MSNVTIKNESNSKSISVTIGGQKKPDIPSLGSVTYPLFTGNQSSIVLKLAMKNPDAWRIHRKPVVQQPLHSSIPVPSIDADHDGTKWTLTFTQGTVTPQKTGGTDHMVMGTREDPKVNVTVGQDIPPVLRTYQRMSAVFSMINSLVLIIILLTSGELWLVLPILLAIGALVTSILALIKETPQADKTEPKQAS